MRSRRVARGTCYPTYPFSQNAISPEHLRRPTAHNAAVGVSTSASSSRTAPACGNYTHIFMRRLFINAKKLRMERLEDLLVLFESITTAAALRNVVMGQQFH